MWQLFPGFGQLEELGQGLGGDLAEFYAQEVVFALFHPAIDVLSFCLDGLRRLGRFKIYGNFSALRQIEKYFYA